MLIIAAKPSAIINCETAGLSEPLDQTFGTCVRSLNCPGLAWFSAGKVASSYSGNFAKTIRLPRLVEEPYSSSKCCCQAGVVWGQEAWASLPWVAQEEVWLVIPTPQPL